VGSDKRRSGETIWLEPEQVEAHRAVKAFIEWWKPLLEGPLHRAGELPMDLSLAAAEMMMCLVDARTQPDAAERARRFRAARNHARRCATMLDTPEALELASAEELGQGHELLRPVLTVLDYLIRPPPDAARARSRRPRTAGSGGDHRVCSHEDAHRTRFRRTAESRLRRDPERCS